MEEVDHEIVDDPELGIRGIWITLSDEETDFEAVVSFVFFAHEVTIFEEPSLGLGGNQFPIPIATKFESAVRN